MSEDRLGRRIPVLDDVDRMKILGYAEQDSDGYITFRIKNDDLTALAEKLETVDQIYGFMLGFQYREKRRKPQKKVV